MRTPELRRKLMVTLGLLLVYRVMASVLVPGINSAALTKLFANNSLLGLLNLFSGAGVQTGSGNSALSIVGTGLNPYINATIIMQLLQVSSVHLRELAKEGEKGQMRINQYTRWLTVPLAAVQAVGYTILLSSSSVNALSSPGPAEYIRIIATFTCSTIVLMWLGELITEYGVGQGVSLIIFAGIISQLPSAILGLLSTGGASFVTLVVVAAIAVAATSYIIWVQQATRKIPTQSAQRIVNQRSGVGIAGGRRNFFPLRVNTAGVIPIIFAISLMFFPTLFSNFFQSATGWVGVVATWVRINWQPNGGSIPVDILYNGVYFMLVFAFTYFYTSVVFDPVDISERLQKASTFIPGIRPGRATAEYLRRVMGRITFAGALFLGSVTVLLPLITSFITGTSSTTLYLGGTAILIVVGVALDTMKQIETQLIMRQQRGFIK